MEYPYLEEQHKITTLGPDEADPYRKLPTDDMKNDMLESSMITHFSKNFDKEQKYSGEPYSLLDDTLTIFFDICWHAQIKSTQLHTVFPNVLTGRREKYHMHYTTLIDEETHSEWLICRLNPILRPKSITSNTTRTG